jgi:uridine phosphorylase
MKSNTRLLVLFLVFSTQAFYCQSTIITKLPDSTTNWKKENKMGFEMTENA